MDLILTFSDRIKSTDVLALLSEMSLSKPDQFRKLLGHLPHPAHFSDKQSANFFAVFAVHALLRSLHAGEDHAMLTKRRKQAIEKVTAWIKEEN
jgi:hypothetical protein